MALAFAFGNTASSTTSPATTAGLSTSVIGDLIVATLADDSGTSTSITSVTDNKGNTYSRIGPVQVNTVSTQMWYTVVTAGGAGTVVSAAFNTGTTARCTIAAQRFNGFLGTATLDQSTATTGTSTSASPGTTGSTTNVNEIIVVGGGHAGATSAFTLGAGYANLNTVNVANAAVAQENKIVSTIGTQTGSLTIAASRAWGAHIATFKDVAPVVNNLQDLFNQNTLNTGKWTQFIGGSATMSYSSTGAQVTFPVATTSSTDGDITSKLPYDLTSSTAYLQVLGVSGVSATSTDCALWLRIDGSNWVRWVYEAGTLFAQYQVAGVTTTLFSVTYSAVTHLYWRIRESGGTTFWDTSADGSSYINQASVANPIALTNLFVLISGTSFGVDISPTPFIWNNFNIIPTPSTITVITYRPPWRS